MQLLPMILMELLEFLLNMGVTYIIKIKFSFSYSFFKIYCYFLYCHDREGNRFV